MASPRKDMWKGFISTLSAAGTGQRDPWFLLLAALQGGLVRGLALWAQQACEGSGGVSVSLSDSCF